MAFIAEELSGVTNPSWAPYGWRKISTQGRHRGTKVYGTSQRPAMINKALLGNCTHIRTSRLNPHTDRQTLALYLDVPLPQVTALSGHGRIQKDMNGNEAPIE